jgi:hypothetical protein
VREKYCWLVAGGWFVLREKYCWLVADKLNEQAANYPLSFSKRLYGVFLNRFCKKQFPTLNASLCS